MTIDATKIGQVAAEVMEDLNNLGEDGEVIAVGIVVVVDQDNETYTRIKTSTDRYYEQLGLFTAAISVAEYGKGTSDGET